MSVLIAHLFVLLGFAVVFRVFYENSFSASTIQVQNEQAVITSGPYRYIRHPMYAGALWMILATPIAMGSYWGILASIALTGIIILRLLDEEKYLVKNLTGYKEYCQKTKYHLFPRLW